MKTLKDVLSAEQMQAVSTALALRAMGSTEKTIIRAFAQEGKEAILGALLALVDGIEAANTDANTNISVAEEARKRRSAEARSTDPTA